MFFIPTENVLISKLSSCLDIFDPVSDVEELKKREKKKQRRSRKERLTRHLKRFGEFSEHHGEKSASERGQGHKIQLLDCAVLTLFYVFVL